MGNWVLKREMFLGDQPEEAMRDFIEWKKTVTADHWSIDYIVMVKESEHDTWELSVFYEVWEE